MEFTQLELLKENIRLIKQILYPDSLSIPVWKTRTATYTVPVEYENYSEWSEMTLGTVWSCPYHGSRWFEASVTIPEHYAGKRVVLELDLGAEGLISINGEAKCSLAHFKAANYSVAAGAMRHRTRVDITDCAKGGEVLNISVQLNMNYKDHFRGSRFVRYDDSLAVDYTMAYANLCTVDVETESYYFDICNLMDAIDLLYTPAELSLNRMNSVRLDPQYDRQLRNLNRDGALRSRMIEVLQKSMLPIPFYYSPEEMRAAIPEAAEILHREMEKLPKSDRGTVYTTGFSHLDLVWLWQQKHSVRKTANTFLNTLELIDRYPEYIFTYSQPCSYDWLRTYYPAIFERVKEKVASGNIDPVGNLWVEMDTNLAGGEAIVRQLLYGRAFYLKYFGKDSNIFFMPDSFGYAASLPQILKKSGVEYFFTHKLGFNEAFRFPYTFFRWQGIDGTKLPAYLMRCAYNGNLDCEHADEVYHRNEYKCLSDKAFLTFGYGDGGGGPDYIMLENARRLKDIPGVPKVKYAPLGTFFRDVFQNPEDFPIWNDELYLDRHRGTYTSQAKIKKNNRRAELALRETEIAASIREICLSIPYPAEQLEALWKKILFLQFHDCLPGSSNTFVNADVEQEYTEFFAEQGSLYESILKDLTAAVPHATGDVISWNFLPWQRQGIPAMGWASAKPACDAITVTPTLMENRFFRIALNEKGHLTSVIHKETGRETLKAPSNIIEIFEDPAKPNLSAWDIQLEYNNVCDIVDDVRSITVQEVTEQRGVLRIVRRHHNSTITQDITIHADVPRVDFVTHVDWHETMRLMKAAFYPNVQASKASYEIQFGAIERPTHRNTEYDQMRFEACAHKWADLSQTDFGVSLLNDCKYGYDIYDGKMRITLLRAGVEPDLWQDQGEHTFTYSLFPHSGNWTTGGTVRAGYELNVPVSECNAPSTNPIADFTSFVTVDSPSVVLDSIKKAENGEGWILRLYESAGSGGIVSLRFCREVRSVTACDLMETDEASIPSDAHGFTFETTPYCIHSYRVIF